MHPEGVLHPHDLLVEHYHLSTPPAQSTAGEPARAVPSNRKQSGDESPQSTWVGDPPEGLATGHRLRLSELRTSNSKL